MRWFRATVVGATGMLGIVACGASAGGRPAAKATATTAPSASAIGAAPCAGLDARLPIAFAFEGQGKLIRAADALRAQGCDADEERRKAALGKIEAELAPDALPGGAIPAEKKRASAQAYAAGKSARLAGDHAKARADFLRAAELRRPWPAGPALVAAGMEALALSDGAGAQRLFDRATIAYERTTGAKMRLGLGQALFCYGVVSNPVHVAWVPRTDWLAVSCHDTTALYDAETGEELARFANRMGTIGAELDADELPAVVLSGASARWDPEAASYWAADGTQVAVVDRDVGKAIAFWQLDAEKPELTITLPARVSHAAFRDDGAMAAIACDDGTIAVIDAKTGATQKTMKGAKPTIAGMRFAPDGKELAVWSNPDGAFVDPSKDVTTTWSLATGKIVKTQNGQPPFTSADGKLAARLRPKWLDVRRVAGNALVRAILVDGYDTERVTFSPSGRYVAATVKLQEDGDWAPRAYRIADGELVRTFPPSTVYQDETVVADAQNHPARLRAPYFDWPIAGPFSVGGYHSMMSGALPSAVSIEGETIDFFVDEIDGYPADPTASTKGAKQQYVVDPRGPVKILDFARARTRVLCRIGAYRLPLEVCRDALTI